MAWRTRTYEELTRPVRDYVPDADPKALQQLHIRTVADLLLHVPRRYVAGTETSDLSALEPGEDAAVVARVYTAKPVFHDNRSRLQVQITDGTSYVAVTFFGRSNYVKGWAQQLTQGARGIFVGRVGAFNGQPQLTNPAFVLLDAAGDARARSQAKRAMAEAVATSGLVGLYPQTKKMRTWEIQRAAVHALELLDSVDDPLPEPVRRAAGVVEWHEALDGVHRPDTRAQVGEGLHRLTFDEAFATQLTMALRRREAAADEAVARPRRSGGLLEAFDAQLPFSLTAGQEQVGEEIFAELAGRHPMQRLLQGEVGSGKTVVALRAMLAVIDAGGQAVLLAPTEVLAAQHAASLRALLGPLGQGGELGASDEATRVALLTGSMPAAAKKKAMLEIASGEAGIVVGTHALLADRVQFADLGLIVIDEQHRFGVEQRGKLLHKASARPHVLVLTATPIPRSVAMTVFGDLTVSTLAEVPRGRADVTTTVVDTQRNPAWVGRAWERIGEECAAGRQAFIVAPSIVPGERGDDDAAPAASVEGLMAELAGGALSGLRVAALHGKLPGEEKERTMAAFARGEIDVLIATTVIEVGVDVPNASVMVICDADRFGISQLHQLRGRIGRGAYPGLCLLLTAAETGTPARERLEAVASTRDGFALADVDLQQRREGDVLGASQSGRRSSLRLLSVLEDRDMIELARDIAERCLDADPELTDPRLADAVAYTEWRALSDEWETG